MIFSNLHKKHKGRLLPAAWLSVLLLVAMTHALAQDPPSRAYQLKAAFLFNFTQFVDWPQQAFAAADQPFVIGVLGSNPFGDYLQQVVSGESWRSHPIVVKTFRTTREAAGSHILFITEGASVGMASFRKKPILTVSDAHDFAERGGVVEFYTVENKIRLRINRRMARQAGLSISSKLLRLADIRN